MSLTDALAAVGIMFCLFALFYGTGRASRKPVWDQAGTIVVMVVYCIILAIPSAVYAVQGGTGWNSRLVYIVGGMAAYYFGKFAGYHVHKRRHERWIRKQDAS